MGEYILDTIRDIVYYVKLYYVLYMSIYTAKSSVLIYLCTNQHYASVCISTPIRVNWTLDRLEQLPQSHISSMTDQTSLQSTLVNSKYNGQCKNNPC